MTTSDQIDRSDDDFDGRFTAVRQWREPVGSRAWRRRAAKELESSQIELFLVETLQRENLSDPERASVFERLQAFNATRHKEHQRTAFLKGAIEVADALGGVISLFGVVGLVSLFFVSSLLHDPYFATWMYFHWAVALVWGISLAVRLPTFVREWRAQRAGPKIDFARMKQEVVYVNGQYLPGEYIPKSANEIAMEKTISRGFDVFLVVIVMGGVGALDNAASRLVPFWLALASLFLGVVGTVLMVRLRTLAERAQSELDRDKARSAAETNLSAAS